jgi:catechol 2,3-dioxygenase-like lactoylglutathione lyase family enzyme
MNRHQKKKQRTASIGRVLDYKKIEMEKSKLIEMNNVGIVVENLDTAISFFTEIGLTLEGRGMVEGEWAGQVTALGNQSVEVAMMVTPDGHSRLELSRFLTPKTISDHRTAPVNSLGYLRVMFRVDNLDELLTRLAKKHDANVVGQVVNYDNIYKLCYIRGTEGLLIGLAEQLGNKTAIDILENNE